MSKRLKNEEVCLITIPHKGYLVSIWANIIEVFDTLPNLDLMKGTGTATYVRIFSFPLRKFVGPELDSITAAEKEIERLIKDKTRKHKGKKCKTKKK